MRFGDPENRTVVAKGSIQRASGSRQFEPAIHTGNSKRFTEPRTGSRKKTEVRGRTAIRGSTTNRSSLERPCKRAWLVDLAESRSQA